MTSIDNLEIRLDDTLAAKRVYPAIDLLRSQVKQGDILFNEKESQVDYWIRNRYMNNHTLESLHEILTKVNTYEQFLEELNI